MPKIQIAIAVTLALVAASAQVQLQTTTPLDPASIARHINDELAAARVPGAAVAVVAGDQVFAGSYGVADGDWKAAMTPATLMHVGSINKLFTAMAVTSALEARKITGSSAVGDHLSGLVSPVAALTFHQLLSQTSGLRDTPGESGSDDERALAAGARALTARDFVVPAGTVFSYSNLGYALAGAALEAMQRKPFADALHDTVFAPLGMASTTLRLREAEGLPRAVGHRLDGATMVTLRTPSNDTRLWPAGYLWTNANDISRALAAVVNQGRVAGAPGMAPGVIARVTEPHAAMPNVFVGGHYGYGLMLANDRGARIYEHGGTQPGFSAILRVAPDRRLGVAILVNLDNAPLRRIAQVVMARPLGLGEVAAASRHETAVTVQEMMPLLGVYRNRGTAELAIRNDSVVLILDGGPPMAVSRIGADRFLARPRPDVAGPEFVLRSGYLHFALWAYAR